MACACKSKNKNIANTDITVEPIQSNTAVGSQEVVANRVNAAAAYKRTIVGTGDTSISDDITVEPITATLTGNKQTTVKANIDAGATELLRDAREINLEQCYLCAKKHIERAKDFFEEYHTGYPDHVKNLIESVQIAERDVMRAFLLWQRIMGQMNMGEGELLGKDANQLKMKSAHITLANKIRDERLRLSDDPLYVPNFDDLLVEIHLLQHKVLDSE